MAEIRAQGQMPTDAGPGWTRTVLADPKSGGGLPMRAERWRLEPGASGPPLDAPGGETMMYIIAGTGTVRVGGTTYAVEPESVIWLSAGDRINLTAGADGLEILLGAADGGR